MTSRELPRRTFLCFASHGDRVIALCKHTTRDEAEGWVARAKAGFVKFADQIAVVSCEVRADGTSAPPRASHLVVGWVRRGTRWVEAAQVKLDFSELT